MLFICINSTSNSNFFFKPFNNLPFLLLLLTWCMGEEKLHE